MSWWQRSILPYLGPIFLSLNLTCILTHLREYLYIIHSTSPILYKVSLYPFNKNSEWPCYFIFFLPFQQLLRKKQPPTASPDAKAYVKHVHLGACGASERPQCGFNPLARCDGTGGLSGTAGRSHGIEVSWDWT